MDRQYYSTAAQLIGTIILIVGLLIANSHTVFNAETDAIYVISMLISLMLLVMLFSTIFTILFLFAMWEKDELGDYGYTVFSIMIIVNSLFIPVVLILFGVIFTIRTEHIYVLNHLSNNARSISHTIEVIYYLLVSSMAVFGIGLQINRKLNSANN